MTNYFEILDAVQHQLVTRENPPFEDLDGMDYERCAALYNAILKHGWVTFGRDASEFDRLARPVIDIDSDAKSVRHSSIRAFLAAALTLEDTAEFNGQKMNFFFHVDTLGPHGDWHSNDDEERILTFYGTLMGHASKMDGLVYDTDVREAHMHFDMCYYLEPYLASPWQPLESILSVWIEMILCQKVVAIPDLVGTEWREIGSDGQWHPRGGPQEDPKTGAKRWYGGSDPWTIQSFTTEDLTRTLATWEALVVCIESKMGLDESTPAGVLLNRDEVEAANIPDGFARKFLLQARKPRFEYIAPGLRIPNPQISASHAPVPEFSDTPEMLLCAGDEAVDAKHHIGPGMRYGLVPKASRCGLYLLACDRSHHYPQEDGFALVLPFPFGNGYGTLT
ncbi:hypothetical protein LTR95_009459 [Oleoguttula sp. CCFEE 5521]